LLIKLGALKKIAASLGITEIGVTSSTIPSYISDRFKQRFKLHPPTKFEESNLSIRLSPQLLLSNCQSIITIFLPYDIKTERKTSEPLNQEPRGKVAKCAQGIDYHKIANRMATEMMRDIQKEVSRTINNLILSDRSPLPERDLAKLSGLGYTGKNCMLINPRYGSYGILANILIDQPIESDNTNTFDDENCVNCDLCIKACPTGALVKPYSLNPALCLSYLSQLSGIYPAALRTKMGNRLYGCDTCQESCPKNRNVESSAIEEFAVTYFPEEPSLNSIIKMTRREYDLTVRATSAGWRGKTTLQRNAVIAMGNSKNEDLIPILAKLLENDSRPVIRLHAAWALGQIRHKNARYYLNKSLKHERDLSVKEEAKSSLSLL